MNTHDSGLAHGTSGSPQTTIDNSALEQKVNELKVTPKYVPTKKHEQLDERMAIICKKKVKNFLTQDTKMENKYIILLIMVIL